MLAFCKRLGLVLGAVSGLALTSGAASAQTTVTDTFDVLITINAFCAITSPTDLDFGSNNLLNADVDQVSSEDGSAGRLEQQIHDLLFTETAIAH